MFDLSITKILVLAVIALIVFGPNELPKVAAQAGRMLRDLRRIAEGAKADLREGLGPEFQEFDFDDLNPKTFVRKHLFDESRAAGAVRSVHVHHGRHHRGDDARDRGRGRTGTGTAARPTPPCGTASSRPFDFEAT